MKKYIRLKSFITNFESWMEINGENLSIGGVKYKIIGQADTIEELCDNFMVEYKNGEHMVFHDFYHLKRHYELYSQEYHHISGRYGCIWVFGKGLIYVAKMNEKGELELL